MEAIYPERKATSHAAASALVMQASAKQEKHREGGIRNPQTAPTTPEGYLEEGFAFAEAHIGASPLGVIRT